MLCRLVVPDARLAIATEAMVVPAAACVTVAGETLISFLFEEG